MKIMVMGSAGTGKSTLAQKLGAFYNTPVFHLDKCFWKPGWVMSSVLEQDEIHKELMTQDNWIIDGNYTTFFEARSEQADTIIYLNLNRWICFYRVLKRYFMNRGKTRIDMAEGCEEKIDLEFLVWIWNYHSKKKRRWIEKLEAIQHKEIIILNGRIEIQNYINGLEEMNHAS